MAPRRGWDTSIRWSSAGLGLALALGLCPHVVSALTVSAAPDITVNLDGTIVTPREVATDDLAGHITLQSFAGSLPVGVAVAAYHDDGANGLLFSVDNTASLPGGVYANPATPAMVSSTQAAAQSPALSRFPTLASAYKQPP